MKKEEIIRKVTENICLEIVKGDEELELKAEIAIEEYYERLNGEEIEIGEGERPLAFAEPVSMSVSAIAVIFVYAAIKKFVETIGEKIGEAAGESAGEYLVSKTHLFFKKFKNKKEADKEENEAYVRSVDELCIGMESEMKKLKLSDSQMKEVKGIIGESLLKNPSLMLPIFEGE